MFNEKIKEANGYVGLLGLIIVLAIIVMLIFFMNSGTNPEGNQQNEVAPQTAINQVREDLSGTEDLNKESNQEIEELLGN